MKKRVLVFLLVASMILQGIGPVSVAYASTTQSGEGILETAEDQNTAEQKEEGVTQKEQDEVTTVEGTLESESESLMSGAMIDGEMPLVQDKEGQTQEETIETEDLGEPGSYAGTWGEWKLGNSGAAILGGGRLAEAPDGMFFFSEENSGTIDYWDAGGIEREAVGEEGTSLNAFSGAVYYVADENLVRRWDRETGAVETILEWDSAIEQLYVVNEEGLYFLASGSIYEYRFGGNVQCVRDDGEIQGFIPTENGLIYAKGEVLDWTLWAGEGMVAKSVSAWDCQGDYLVITIDGQDYQKEISALFSGFRSAGQLETYSLGEVYSIEDLLGGVEECEVCAENARLVASGALSVEEEEAFEESASITAYASVSTGQKNIIKRARQQYEIEWTPLADLYGWNKSYTFKKGVTYQGLPYGQPVYGRFIPFDSNDKPLVGALQEFLTAVNTPGSLMYTKTSTYNKIAPYYSADCSSFVSYAWNLYRHTTASLPGESTKVANQSIYSVQLGDIFNKSGSHTVLVADIGYNSDGTIEYIDILEETPPKVKRTRYGGNGEQSLAQLNKKYLQSGYTLYRFNNRNAVSYSHSCASPIDQDYCSSCGKKLYFESKDYWVKEGESITLSVKNTTGVSVTWKSLNPDVASVNSSGRVTGLSSSVKDSYGNSISAVIQVSAGGQSAVCTVHVTGEIADPDGEGSDPELFEPTLNGFVNRLYKLILGRTAKQDEVNFWTDILARKEMSGASVAAGFVFSTEYQRKNVSNHQFVLDMYRTMMGRTPKNSEISFWQEYLDAGFTRNFVFEGFANSTEFGSICNRFGIVRGSYSERGYVDKHEKITFFVARFYQICLDRNPKTEEAEDWVRRLVNGTFGGREVAYGFYFSEEFKRKNLSNEEYVTSLYRTFLDREPSSSEHKDWVDRLKKGATRSYVFDGFAYSVEFSRICRSYGIDI